MKTIFRIDWLVLVPSSIITFPSVYSGPRPPRYGTCIITTESNYVRHSHCHSPYLTFLLIRPGAGTPYRQQKAETSIILLNKKLRIAEHENTEYNEPRFTWQSSYLQVDEVVRYDPSSMNDMTAMMIKNHVGTRESIGHCHCHGVTTLTVSE
jgi:hypothetical protein